MVAYCQIQSLPPGPKHDGSMVETTMTGSESELVVTKYTWPSSRILKAKGRAGLGVLKKLPVLVLPAERGDMW